MLNCAHRRLPVRNSRLLISLVILAVTGPGALAVDPVVSNVRAMQLPEKTVQVLYDLSGAPEAGATVTVAFSQDSGTTYSIEPAVHTLSGHVGTGIVSGTNRRIVWRAPANLPAEFYKTTMRAAVTAVDPGSRGEEITIMLPGGVPMVLVKIPKGTFLMGSPESERGRFDDETQHQVTLTEDYYLGRYPVTQGQWKAVMGTDPCNGCFGPADNYPVRFVSWNAIAGPGGFIEKLNRQQGTTKFRLPTEAEWERAARAGTTTRFSHGDVLECDDLCGSCAAHTQYMWWCGNSPAGLKPVGLKQPNGYGLYDMHGNLEEWVNDWYVRFLSAEDATDPTGPVSGSFRVQRGGRWYLSARTRSAHRSSGPPQSRGDIGFRLARSQ